MNSLKNWFGEEIGGFSILHSGVVSVLPLAIEIKLCHQGHTAVDKEIHEDRFGEDGLVQETSAPFRLLRPMQNTPIEVIEARMRHNGMCFGGIHTLAALHEQKRHTCFMYKKIHALKKTWMPTITESPWHSSGKILVPYFEYDDHLSRVLLGETREWLMTTADVFIAEPLPEITVG